jgi:D-lyxose ketol-isomerase
MHTIEAEVLAQARALVIRSGFPITAAELDALQVNDFGLGDVLQEGAVFYDLFRSARIRITLLILLPGQTLPQHAHPAYDNEPGKEETMRVLWGQARVYTEGEGDEIRVPAGKTAYYTARRQVTLHPGEQCTIAPGIEHWFQAGEEGAVTLTFQNRVDETRNVFLDPRSTGCQIKHTD